MPEQRRPTVVASKWWEVSLRAPAELVETAAAIFRYFGQEGVAIEENIPPGQGDDETVAASSFATVKIYLRQDASAWRKIARIEAALGHLASDLALPPLYLRALDEEDWANAWKSHFHVLKVGRRLVIKPSWEAYDPGDDEVVIDLDPGMAFGTGLHPTTHMCLVQIEERLKPGMRVLDLGTGSGILAIAAAKLGAASVVALDIDPEAAWIAQQNVAANSVGEAVKVFPGTLDDKVSWGAFDLVVANITAGVIADLAPELMQALAADGTLIAGGIIADRQGEVQQALLAAGARAMAWREEGDWRTAVVGLP